MIEVKMDAGHLLALMEGRDVEIRFRGLTTQQSGVKKMTCGSYRRWQRRTPRCFSGSAREEGGSDGVGWLVIASS